MISYGTVSAEMFAAARLLQEKGIPCAALRLLSVTAFSADELAEKVPSRHVFVVEEVCHGSGISGDIALCLQEAGLDCIVHPIDLGNNFVPHGDMHSLYVQTGLYNGCITSHIREVLRHEN